jgi:hypothetical protein
VLRQNISHLEETLLIDDLLTVFGKFSHIPLLFKNLQKKNLLKDFEHI